MGSDHIPEWPPAGCKRGYHPSTLKVRGGPERTGIVFARPWASPDLSELHSVHLSSGVVNPCTGHGHDYRGLVHHPRILPILSLPLSSLSDEAPVPAWGLTHSKEDVAGSIETSGIDAGGIGRPAVTEDATGVTRDGALRGGALGRPSSGGCVCHHEVDHVLRGAADL